MEGTVGQAEGPELVEGLVMIGVAVFSVGVTTGGLITTPVG